MDDESIISNQVVEIDGDAKLRWVINNIGVAGNADTLDLLQGEGTSLLDGRIALNAHIPGQGKKLHLYSLEEKEILST